MSRSDEGRVDHRRLPLRRERYFRPQAGGRRFSVMETRSSPPVLEPPIDVAGTPAEELPELYRQILGRVAELEHIGNHAEAGRVRMAATAAYSSAWDKKHRDRLVALLGRADRDIGGGARPRGWAHRQRSAPAR
jgi:hypothetical protein